MDQAGDGLNSALGEKELIKRGVVQAYYYYY